MGNIGIGKIIEIGELKEMVDTTKLVVYFSGSTIFFFFVGTQSILALSIIAGLFVCILEYENQKLRGKLKRKRK